jgi:hypothetical protein
MPYKTSHCEAKHERKLVGMKPCNKPCNLCPYIPTSKNFSSSQTDEKFEMNDAGNCNTKGVII